MTKLDATHVDVDPIMVEIFRTRLEAISQEAGAAIEKTAISPIVTETKDYAVTLLNAAGTFIGGAAAVPGQFGVATHAVTGTLARHAESIADGDVFIANDPHTDGGFHPQDVVVQRPVFFDGDLVAWVAISAHMMDMGGMVPGSSATKATECYQEALRFPSVRLFRAGVEAVDMWEVLRTNLRTFDVIEMDLRSLVVGSHVAAEKLRALIAEIGTESFRSWAYMLDVTTGIEFRRRLALLEPGSYTTTAFAEVGDELYPLPCTMHVGEGTLTFDLTNAPPQIPHFVNSKPYILRASLVPSLMGRMAPDLPLTQSTYDSVELLTTPGSILDCRPPAPIGAAHMDAAIAVHSAALQCLQLALFASPRAQLPLTAPTYDAQGTTRWSFLNDDGHRQVFTLLDGVAGGSPAGVDRDGMDANRDVAGRTTSLQMSDSEVIESTYPILYRSRGAGVRPAGAGTYRAGAGCRTVIEPHGINLLEGIMTGTRGWFPCSGGAGGRPGALTSFRVVRAEGEIEDLSMHATGVGIREGDRFELTAASGGGFGDPLDRNAVAVARDLLSGRTEPSEARDIYGVVLTLDGEVDDEATKSRRAALLMRRLEQAAPPGTPVRVPGSASAATDSEWPLYPGVVQRGGYAISVRSGAKLAVAPCHWTDGCPVLEEPYDGPGPVPLVLRSYLDPVTGHSLQTELVPENFARSFETMPFRWTEQTRM
jgi:N-methylhydantoinase B